ncbi:hypothetical protein SDC9_113799 [bioreactor metagenome]|uniref:Acyl-CoA dehydrogenase/oxidase C-terminal domain-containing protein n=1 Tax=bioreactor metagenome TaxID=1076179 RepID=A0A645BNR6_9ZZZZ
MLARTDATAQRHKGISFLLVDMKLPGVRVSPIRQITGEADFNEVFFEDVKVPLDALVGEENGGWRLAMAAASFERGTYFIPRQVRFAQEVEALKQLAAKTQDDSGTSMLDSPHLRRDIARLAVDSHVLQLKSWRALTHALRGGPPGPEGSATKLHWSESHQKLLTLATELLGERALAGLLQHLRRPPARRPRRSWAPCRRAGSLGSRGCRTSRRWRPGSLGHAHEGVRRLRGLDGVGGHLHAAVRAVLEAHGARQAAGKLAVALALGGAGIDRAPAHEVADELRGEQVQELRAHRQAPRQDVEQQHAGALQALVDGEAVVQVRVVNEALPALGGAGLLEIDAHHDEQVLAQRIGLLFQQARVLHVLAMVVDGAGGATTTTSWSSCPCSTHEMAVRLCSTSCCADCRACSRCPK